MNYYSFLLLEVIVLAHFVDSQTEENFHNFGAFRMDKEGTETFLSFGNFEGKIIMVVNVASECGFTADHYDGMNALYKLFHPTGKFEILAFPCNQFGNQEPMSSREVFNHVTTAYGAKFPLFQKIDVIGHNAASYYKWLATYGMWEPDWNFWKYFVSADGKKVLGAWGPATKPEQLAKHIENWIVQIPDKDEAKTEEKREL